MVILVILLSNKPLWSQIADSNRSSPSEKARTKDDQLRQIQIDKAKLEMELAKKLMEKKRRTYEPERYASRSQ